MAVITRIGEKHWEERGKRIEKARKFAGLSQGELAKAMSDLSGTAIGRQVVYNLEQGDRDIRGDELRTIARVLGQSEAWIDGAPDATFDDSPQLYITWTDGTPGSSFSGLPPMHPLAA